MSDIDTAVVVDSLKVLDPECRLEKRTSLSCPPLRSLTLMYGPAVRSKKILKSWRSAVLHQCIRPYVGALCSGPSWISARLRSH